MRGFSWVVDKKLAGLPCPGDWGDLDSDLKFLSSNQIGLLFTLTESPLNPDRLAAHNVAGVHLPVADFTAPTLDQLRQFVAETRVAHSRDIAVGVHCRAGMGRTGTFLASWLVAEGVEPREAIRQIRRLRPGSVETEEQEEAIREFARHLAKHPI